MLDDIVSDYCDLPRGPWKVEYLPVYMVSGWTAGVPSPNIVLGRWYKVEGYHSSLAYNQGTQATDQGQITDVNVSILVISDSQGTADTLERLGNMRVVLRITDFAGKQRIIGRPGEYADLVADDLAPGEILGAQGYKLSFSATLSKRPIVV